jgi:hypothetical protein
MNYLDEFGLSDDDIKAIDEGIKEANKFFAKVSLKDSWLLLELLLKDFILQILDSLSIK